MRSMLRSGAVAAALAVSMAGPGSAQSDKVMADLVLAVSNVEQKLMALAKALPDAAFIWRPSEGTRTSAEVFQHVAGDNYYLPVLVGVPAPEATGIKSEYPTVQAYETRKISRDAILADLTASFAHLKQAMEKTTPAQLSEMVNMFGQSRSKQQVWILTTTHLHEHLGQMIAYARANNIKPPWSN